MTSRAGNSGVFPKTADITLGDFPFDQVRTEAKQAGYTGFSIVYWHLGEPIEVQMPMGWVKLRARSTERQGEPRK